MNFSRPGALDLSALAQRQQAPASAPADGSGGWVVHVTEQTFQQVALEASLHHLVVLSLWSPRAPQSAEFNARLAAAVNALGGKILLAQVDVDSQPGIAQALGAQSVPLVVGLVKGQPVPLFQSVVDDAQIRAYLDELVKVGVQNGITGRAAPVGGPVEEEAEEVADPRFAAADEAFATGDLATAVAEYEKLALQHPADVEVKERLAGARLMQRTAGADLSAARQAAADAPDDVAAQLLVADLDVSGGHVQDAFERLIELVKRSSPEDRDLVRERLLELFTLVGSTDPRVSAARRALAAALF